MKELQEILEKKQRELDRVQRDVDILRETLRIMREDGQPQEGKVHHPSQPRMVVAILEAAGEPMHVSKIAAQIQQQFKKTVKKNNLGVLLYRYHQRGKHFYKVPGVPNTYGLLKWRPVASLRVRDMKTVQ